MSGCCEQVKLDVAINLDSLVVGDHVQTSNAKVTTGLNLTRGNLMKVGADNVLAAGTAGDWDVIVIHTMDADQVTYHADNGLAVGVYNQGEFAVDLVKIDGVVLDPADYDKAMAVGTKKNIELRKVA